MKRIRDLPSIIERAIPMPPHATISQGAAVERLRAVTEAQVREVIEAERAGAESDARAFNREVVRLEAEVEQLRDVLTGIKERDAEVGEDESWWIGGAWGEYGEAVVPLRILSYVIDGNLDEKVASIDPGFALTYAEQVARADAAEALLARIRELVTEHSAGPDDPFAYGQQVARRVLEIMDGDNT